jgi:tetratricopeptide (TPR) repeat protein
VQIDREATLKNAEKLLRQGKLEAALAEYVRVVTTYPNDWNSVNALGDLYVRAGQSDKAIVQFARVGDHLLKEGAFARAVAIYKKIVRINPEDPRGTRGLAHASEKLHASRPVHRGGPPVPPDDPDARMLASRTAQDVADVARACELLVEAADLYEAQGKPADAVAAIAEASGIDPANVALRERLLRMLIAQGELVQARYVARAVSELVVVADAFERAGDRGNALDTIAEAARAEPENQSLRDRVLHQFIEAGELDRARQLARSAADLLLVAQALNKAHRGGEVLDLVSEAVDREPHNVALRGQLVTACLASGDIERARGAARTAHDWVLLAKAMQKQGRSTDALAAMLEATQRDPHDVGLHSDFVRACIDARDLWQAREVARTKAEIVAVADALEAAGDAAAARDMRADALRRDPDDPMLRLRLIRDYIAAGDHDRAHALLTLDVAGDDPELILLLVRLEFGIGRLAEGRRALAHLLTTHPERRDEAAAIGRELLEAGENDAAFLCVELFAESAAAVGNWSSAASALEQFVERVPHHAAALSKLIDIYVDAGLESRIAPAQGQLADAYLRAGQAVEARVIAEDLVLRAPWERSSIERCLRALFLCGDPDPERTIADLLSTDATVETEGEL